MTVATITDWVVAAPASFTLGLVVGFWVGARFDVRKKRDINGPTP